jgi:uncharacterized sulfatase
VAITDILMVNRGAREIAPKVWTIGGQGNSLIIDHGEGVILVDAGPGKDITDAMIQGLRQVTEKRVTHIVISHGHLGYNFGVHQWNEHAKARNEPPPVLVGHERVAERYQRYRETAGLQSYTNTRQFRSLYPADFPEHWFANPQLSYQETLRIVGTERDIVLRHAPSETDDATAVWLPSEALLYGGPACISSCPNAGSPYRIARSPLRWAQTLESFFELRPKVLVPEFGRTLTDKQEIEDALTIPVRAIRWLRAAVVERMNLGLSENEILHDLAYPPELFGHRFMRPVYGCPDYLVREIWRLENGWWDRNPTSLHPARNVDVAAEIVQLIEDPQRVLARARQLASQGKVQLALHVVDLLALANDDSPAVKQAHELKAELLFARASQMTSVVSGNLMKSDAESLLGKPIGSSDQSDAETAFSWT